MRLAKSRPCTPLIWTYLKPVDCQLKSKPSHHAMHRHGDILQNQKLIRNFQENIKALMRFQSDQ